jgi:tetratricopeptide (TPR) repeat protein
MYSRLAVVCLLAPWLAVAQEQSTQDLFTQAQNQLLAGEYLSSRDGFAKVWKAFAKERGENDTLTLEARIFYGQVLTMTGKPQEAMTVLGPVSGGDDRTAMIARGSFALALRQAGQVERAAKLLADLVKIFPHTPNENLIHLGRMQSELAVCLSYMERFREAEAAATEALRLLDNAPDPIPAHRASVNTVLGQIYLLSGRDRDAYRTLLRAREEARPFWRPDHPELGVLEAALGLLDYRAGNYDSAEKRTRIALASVQQLLGPDHSEVAMISTQLALILKKQKRKEESKEMEARARRILDRIRVDPKVSAWGWREVK